MTLKTGEGSMPTPVFALKRQNTLFRFHGSSVLVVLKSIFLRGRNVEN